ncbi:Uncharacterized conserved protein [Alteromonadaceae bacterium Bs31]|nr:Uncharacterized conserved protein [Alteromonadaceae bacterium Bs31]
MNEYMLIYKGGDPDFRKDDASMAEIMEAWGAWFAKLEQQGNLANGGSPLHFAGKRIAKDMLVTDIAASELKELVSGYSIIKAESLEQAVEISKGCPIFDAPIMSVEVREIMKLG